MADLLLFILHCIHANDLSGDAVAWRRLSKLQSGAESLLPCAPKNPRSSNKSGKVQFNKQTN